ncbi:MAG: FAD-linked oxidase C-terminal domain-containing protein [Gemmatimonadota bacterium]|nr:FAD-linked oxidase C-terminal domain-containing protein [Gemmatimonadota bacterium]
MTTTDDLFASLETLLGDRFSTATALREQHGAGESFHTPAPPDAVAFPETTEEVADVVRLCSTARVPVVPFGAGTSLEGHVHAVRGGVTIALGRMTRVLSVNRDDMDCRVQAGVTRRALEMELRPTGLFFPVDPGADATIGGMVATGASGTTTVRYGTMRENVLGLTVVLADGTVIRTGTRARKSSAGYDLTRLFVGSEGTLGVITEVGLRLRGVPEAVSAAVCSFATLEGAASAVTTCVQMGVPVARAELLDDVQMDAVNRFSGFDYAVSPTVFFEFHGTPEGVREHTEAVEEIAAEFGGADFRWATLQEDRTALWHARHEAYYAALALRPGSRGWATDVCVPVSRLAETIAATRADIDVEGLLAPIVGHVGDGNFHVLFLLDPDDHGEMERAERVNARMVERAIDAGGTCTGEHGVGFGKVRYLRKEHGDALDAMRRIKRALDPDGIMNPGKVIE